jgi:Na+-translocating ferredoxin:NAD+ oxidoreductase RnfA subunit
LRLMRRSLRMTTDVYRPSPTSSTVLYRLLGVHLRHQKRTSCPVLGVALEGFLKRIRIGDDVKYNLEFKLPSISEQLH